jgi:hypothetical protein
MTIWLSDAVLDGGLDFLDTNGTRIDIQKTQHAASYSEATTDGANSLGYKTGVNIGAPEPGTTNGRMVTVPVITDGTVTETGNADYFSITNGSDTLYVTGTLSAQQAVTDGNVFTLTEFTIRIPDPA